MKTLTKAQLVIENDALRTDNSALNCALNDLANGAVKWFGHSREWSLGISRPHSACGGIAIVRYSGMTAAYYFESYSRAELNHISLCITGERTQANDELLRRRGLDLATLENLDYCEFVVVKRDEVMA